MKNIVDEKQFRTKEIIKIISPLNAFRKLLVSEMFKLVNLILLVPTTDVGSEILRSTLCRVETYMWSSLTQEPVSSCLIFTTYIKQVDKLKLVEVANQFSSKLNIGFQLKNRYFPRKFIKGAAKGTQTPSQRCSSVITQQFIYHIWFTYVIYIIYC